MKYKCGICGATFEVADGEAVVCPVCFSEGDVIEPVAAYELPRGDSKALYNIGYGLYVITASDGQRVGGMIGNSIMQLTSNPNRVAVSINKANFTAELVLSSGMMNACVIAKSAPFSLFERFGFKSSRDTDKFEGLDIAHSSNGLPVVREHINAYMSLKVEQSVDVGSHWLFICELVDGGVMSDEEGMSYAYYHASVKPKKPSLDGKKRSGFVCRICGYVYEGDTLPSDFVCPICKHGAEDFEPLG